MPLLWFRIASEGLPPERYTLQVPFQLAPTHALTPADAKELAFGDHTLQIVENQGIQLLRITGFKTPDEAEASFQQLRGALCYVVVREKLSVRSTTDMQKVQRQEPPVDVRGNRNFGDLCERHGWTHLDGYVDPSPAVVIPEHLRIMEFGAGSVSVTIGMPVPSFLKRLAEGLGLPHPERIAADERLSLAIDLYAASLWQTSRRARVVGLATSLEALIEPERVSEAASDQIDQLLDVFDSARDRSAEDEEQRSELDRVRSRLAGVKEKSISERLRELAAAHANVIGVTTEEARRKMVSAYGVRSRLVHDGYAPEDEIADAAAWLDQAVPAILGSLANEASMSLPEV
jgi:hypothetical protein